MATTIDRAAVITNRISLAVQVRVCVRVEGGQRMSDDIHLCIKHLVSRLFSRACPPPGKQDVTVMLTMLRNDGGLVYSTFFNPFLLEECGRVVVDTRVDVAVCCM